MPIRTLVCAALATLLLLPACTTTPNGGSPPAPGAMARNQGYALLYSTISDEADVSKILILKSPAHPVAELLKEIAKLCTDAKTGLEAFAKSDATIDLKHDGLPPLELKSRASISDATTKQVLLASGNDFEFTILLTQHEALNYIHHTALVLAKDEPNPTRSAFLSGLAQHSDALHDRVIGMLKTPYVGKAN